MQTVFAHTQSRHWGIGIDVQEVVVAGLTVVYRDGEVLHTDSKGAKTPPSGGEGHC